MRKDVIAVINTDILRCIDKACPEGDAFVAEGKKYWFERVKKVATQAGSMLGHDELINECEKGVAFVDEVVDSELTTELKDLEYMRSLLYKVIGFVTRLQQVQAPGASTIGGTQ